MLVTAGVARVGAVGELGLVEDSVEVGAGDSPLFSSNPWTSPAPSADSDTVAGAQAIAVGARAYLWAT